MLVSVTFYVGMRDDCACCVGCGCEDCVEEEGSISLSSSSTGVEMPVWLEAGVFRMEFI
jgi:hypothetical protein